MQHLATKTPVMTKAVKSVSLTYCDGTEATIEVQEDAGFHRVEHYGHPRKSGDILIHEIFITTTKDEDARPDTDAG